MSVQPTEIFLLVFFMIYLFFFSSLEMHPLWPYGATTILSPLMPANLALPYTLPYAAVPIYQNGPQCATSSPVSNVSSASSNGSQTNHTQPPSTATTNGCASGINCSTNTQNTSNDSNKINIQIQCVSQNAPVNFNSMHDSLAKVNFGNFCNTSCQMGEKDNNKGNQPTFTATESK